MKKYLSNWNEEKKAIEIKVFEDNKLIDVIQMPNDSSETYFVEAIFDDGNFITSNRFSNLSNDFMLENNNRIYQHYKIVNINNHHEVIKGKRWNDGFWRNFTSVGEDLMDVRLCLDGSASSYDCMTFNEVSKDDMIAIRAKVLSKGRKLS